MPCFHGLAAARVPAVKWRTRVELLILMDAARHKLEQELDEPLTTQDLAREAGLSTGRFIRVFRRVYGLPPRQWRARARLAAASGLLRNTNLSVSAISAEAGYSSASAFCRRHRESCGVSPGQERRRMSIQEHHGPAAMADNVAHAHRVPRGIRQR